MGTAGVGGGERGEGSAQPLQSGPTSLNQPLCSSPGLLVGLEHMWLGDGAVTEILPGWCRWLTFVWQHVSGSPQNLGGVCGLATERELKLKSAFRSVCLLPK